MALIRPQLGILIWALVYGYALKAGMFSHGESQIKQKCMFQI